jgi:hypothetical protein
MPRFRANNTGIYLGVVGNTWNSPVSGLKYIGPLMEQNIRVALGMVNPPTLNDTFVHIMTVGAQLHGGGGFGSRNEVLEAILTVFTLNANALDCVGNAAAAAAVRYRVRTNNRMAYNAIADLVIYALNGAVAPPPLPTAAAQQFFNGLQPNGVHNHVMCGWNEGSVVAAGADVGVYMCDNSRPQASVGNGAFATAVRTCPCKGAAACGAANSGCRWIPNANLPNGGTCLSDVQVAGAARGSRYRSLTGEAFSDYVNRGPANGATPAEILLPNAPNDALRAQVGANVGAHHRIGRRHYYARA